MSFGKGEKRTKIMISAHMDEVGFMVDGIRSDGMLTFGRVGGIDPSVIAGRKITLEGKEGLIGGVICSKAIHHKDTEEREKPIKADKLYMDIGVSDKEDAEKLVGIGSFATFDSEFYTFGKDAQSVKGKALDDRMGCAAMLEIMEDFRNAPPDIDADVYFCFTVREEIGYSGADAAARLIAPDLSIVLETTAISDRPDTEPHRRVADVGGGAAISVADRATIYDREIVDFALELGKSLGIGAQSKRYVSGGNDAGHIHKVLDGIKVLAVSVPTRYLHSPACVASIKDYEAVRDLASAIIKTYKRREI
jgi:endoglucanase